MNISKKTSLSDYIIDRFASEWKLLSETESYLSKTQEFYAYEKQFQQWRRRLQKKTMSDTEITSIRSEIVALRKELRLKGYDLSLGLQRLVLAGFMNDEALGKGYKRLVLCFCDPYVYFLTGSGNHIDIANELETNLTRRQLLNHPEMHYLWYFRNAQGLILAGSATETKELYLRLEDRIKANSLKLLTSLKKLN